jgi:hypothetical protein
VLKASFSLQHVCGIISIFDTSAELILISINTIELSVSNAVFEPSFTPYALIQWYLQSKDIFNKSQNEMRILSEYSAFNAQGPRLIIVVVQLGAVKI